MAQLTIGASFKQAAEDNMLSCMPAWVDRGSATFSSNKTNVCYVLLSLLDDESPVGR